MEHAGRQIEDEEIREQMKDCALGTPATRAAIIERLIDVGYVQRSGKTLVATEKGVHLIEAVPPEIASPETTGRWNAPWRKSQGEATAKRVSVRALRGWRRFWCRMRPRARRGVCKGRTARQKTCSDARRSLSRLRSGQGGGKQQGFYCTRFREGCKFTIWKDALTRVAARC